MYFLSAFTLPIRSLSRSPLSTQANSFTHSLIQVAHSFTFSPIHKLIQSPTYSFSHIFNQTFNNSLLFRHLLPTSIPYLFTNSFTHQLIHCQKRNQTFKTFNNSLLFSFTYASSLQHSVIKSVKHSKHSTIVSFSDSLTPFFHSFLIQVLIHSFITNLFTLTRYQKLKYTTIVSFSLSLTHSLPFSIP